MAYSQAYIVDQDLTKCLSLIDKALTARASMMPPQPKQKEEVQNLFGMEDAQLRNSNYM